MDIVKGIQRSLDVYLKNFVLLFLATLVTLAISGASFGILAGPLFGGLIVLILKLLRGEKAEFNEIFAHFDKFVPTLLVSLIILAAYIVLWLITYLVAPIWLLGPLLVLVLNIAIYPVMLLFYVLALSFVVDKGAAPLDGARKAVGCLLTNPLMIWLYAVVIGILAGLGGFIAMLINLGLVAALSFLGLFLTILTIPLMIALWALTVPVGILGLSAAYEELSLKEPGQLKLNKQVLQIGGIVLACLVVVGLAARFAFHRNYYNAWSVGRLFGVRSGIGAREPSRAQFGGFDVGEGLPKDFPRDVPIYPGAKVEGSLGGSSKDASGSWTNLTTKDPPDKIYAFYQQKLEAKGWKMEQSIIGMSFTKGDQMVTVMATESDGKTDIILSVDKEK